jgi:hypothetical protein
MTMHENLTRERIERARERAENQAKIYRGAMIDLQKKYKEEPEMFLEGEYEADYNYIKDGIEDYETFLTLANAELERQSVRDDMIEQLICDIKTSNLVFEEDGNSSDAEGWERNMIIDALSVYQSKREAEQNDQDQEDEDVEELIACLEEDGCKVILVDQSAILLSDSEKELILTALQAYRPEREEHPVGDIRYFAVTTEDGEILGYFDLVSNEAVGKKGILTRIGYGEPTFIDRDGVVYLGGSEVSE